MQMLSHGIGGSLKPVRIGHGLFGSEHFDETFCEWVKPVGVCDVAVQRSRVELSQDEDFFQPRIQAVADGNVDEPVLSSKRHRRFRAVLRQREQTLSCASCKNDRKYMCRAFFALSD